MGVTTLGCNGFFNDDLKERHFHDETERFWSQRLRIGVQAS
jgi:hypothetical protein